MAFRQRDLGVLAYDNGFTLWRYVTDDEIGTVRTPGYFDDAQDMLRRHDQISLGAKDTSGALVVSFSEPGKPVLVEPIALAGVGA